MKEVDYNLISWFKCNKIKFKNWTKWISKKTGYKDNSFWKNEYLFVAWKTHKTKEIELFDEKFYSIFYISLKNLSLNYIRDFSKQIKTKNIDRYSDDLTYEEDKSLVVKDLISRVCNYDTLNIKIINNKLKGYTSKEIIKRLKISKFEYNKRLNSVKELLGEEKWMKYWSI